MQHVSEWLTELYTQQSPLSNDPTPGVRGVDEIPQVVIGYNDPVCFFC